MTDPTLLVCPPRNPMLLMAAVNSLKLETNEIYQPGYLVPGTTWCNRFATDITALLSCEIPFRKANQQLEYLAGLEGATAGWYELTGPVKTIVAVDQAERGFPCVAVWSNPNGHGHIALLVPGPKGKMFIAQAGASCFSSGPVTRGFWNKAQNALLPFRLFTHN